MSTAATEIVLDTFKELVWDSLVKEVLKQLFLKAPLLGWGPFGFIITHFALKYSDELYAGIKMFIQVEAIALRNKQFHREYQAASIKLHVIAGGAGITSTEFREARDANKKALSNFVNFDFARAS